MKNRLILVVVEILLFVKPLSAHGNCDTILNVDTNSVCRGVWYQSDYTECPVYITNGSLLGFSDNGFIGNTVRFLSFDNKTGLSHVAIALVAYPSEMLRLISLSIKAGGLSKREQYFINVQLKDICDVYPYLELKEDSVIVSVPNEEMEVFCLEVTGKDESIIRGIQPRVLIAPLKVTEKEYSGNVSVRRLREEIPMEMLAEHIIENLGIGMFSKAEGYGTTIYRMIMATYRINAVANSETWFCAEFVTYVYQQCRVVTQKIRPIYGIPKYYSTRNKKDLLENKAEEEQWLKVIYNPIHEPDLSPEVHKQKKRNSKKTEQLSEKNVPLPIVT